jgi:hypothetical protein
MKKFFPGLLCVMLAFGTSAYAGADRGTLADAIVKLNREAAADFDLAGLIQSEYGTPDEDMKWAAERSLNWGEIAALAYIRATTGRSFAEMDQEDARRDFWSYAEKAGMSCEKMAHSLESFLKQAQRERNSRIFERLRASRRVHALPDLGSGFGLFQEALDFRRIDSPRPTKIHTGVGVLAKGGK